MKAQSFNCHILETSTCQQLLFTIIENNGIGALCCHKKTSQSFFRSIDSNFLDDSFEPSTQCTCSIAVWLQNDDGCKFLLRIAWFSKIQFDGYWVWNIERAAIIVKILSFFFVLCFFGDGIQRSYIIEMSCAWVKMLCFITEILDYNDAADHEDNVLFSNDLKLVMYWCRTDSEGCIKGQSKGGCEFSSMKSFSSFAVLVLYGSKQSLALFCFHYLLEINDIFKIYGMDR